MSCHIGILTCIKSRQFDKAANLLKENQRDVDGRTTFKLLRSLAGQLKINPGNKNEESVKKFMQECCAILDCSQDFTAEDAEFTQGVLSLYHLVTVFITSEENSEICVMLSKTFLSCIRKFDKTLKDVESIVANFFAQMWSVANKVNSELAFTYRSLSLVISVHSGSSYWNRVIDKLIVAVQETSSASFKLAGSVFDEFLLYFSNHTVKGSQGVSSLLQVWTQLVFHSSSSNQHEDRTTKLKSKAKDIQESKQVTWLIDLVLNLFKSNDKEIDMSSKNLKHFLTKDFEVVMVRIVILALNYSGVALSQSAETKWDRKIQMVSTINILLHFCREVDRLGVVAEANMQIDPTNLRIKCLSRACSISFHLIKLDLSKIDLCKTVFHHVDQLYTQGIKDQSKGSSNVISIAESIAYNVGVIYFQKSDFPSSSTYFRKALEYMITNQSLEISEGEATNTFSSRFTTLYESRKAIRDWSGAIGDFLHCLSSYYIREESSGKIRCKSVATEQLLFVMWSRFKRDVYHGYVPADSTFLKMTVADLFKQTNLTLDSNSVWDFLLEEFQALDRRKGSVPRAAISAVAEQATALAKSPFQKGVSYYLMSREGDNHELRHTAAKKSVGKFAAHAAMGDIQSQGQVYLALAYLELFVSQQEMLKKKTEEEMESLGPLIQSNSNAEVPPGEDATSLTNDGTSLDAVSYSYLKLELELKNQEWMVKSLQQWEELVQFGWTPKHYSSVIFNGLKSLGYYFNLNGNSFFSARSWLITLKLAESVKSDEELLLAASELLKLGWTLETRVLDRCQELVEKKTLVTQDEIHFFLSLSWSKYFQHKFTESWQILDEKVLRSPALCSETPSKSVLLLISQGNLLRSLLSVLPEELSQISPSNEVGPVQAGVKAAQFAYTSLKCYVQHSHQQNSWDFPGQEWNALRHFLFGAMNVARIYLYTASPREARFFLKEALNAAQKHVSVLRTAEALLELCNVDLMLDNTMDCQSKLVLICHLMGVAPPVIPDETIANGGKKSLTTTPGSPVQIRADRRKGITSRKVPEIPIQLEQDSTNRMLLLPLNHLGASPSTKAREVSDGIFPEHSTECVCLICSGELVSAIRCTAVLVQAKLWSFMGFHELALEDFVKGQILVQSICSRLKSSAKPVTTKTSSKRLFDVPDCLKVNEMWALHKVHWFQPSVITGLELLLEHVMHRSVTESASFQPAESLASVKSVLYELYMGPLEHRAIKLMSAITLISSVVPRKLSIMLTPEPSTKDNDDEDDSVIILEGGFPPKTPAFGLRKPLELPAPRRVRRNLMNVKIEDTITIDDDEDSDGGFSRRRLGKPQKAILYSSDSDSDVLPPTPPPTKPKPQSRTRTLASKKNTEVPSPVELTVQPIEKRQSKRGTSKTESNNDDLNNRPVVAPKVYSRTTRKIKSVEIDAEPESVPPNKTEKKISKTKTAAASKKDELGEAELSNRLAATKISAEITETKETRPKRTTRSTRK